MLICHKHKFLFIHIYQCLISSITMASSTFAVYNAAHLAIFRLTDWFKWRFSGAFDPRLLKVHISAQSVSSRWDSKNSGAIFPLPSFGIRASLPRLNISKTRPYQEYYNTRTIEMIRRTFAPDIECFGYDFA